MASQLHALGTAAEAAVASEDFGKARALYSQLLQHTQAKPLVLAAARAEVSLVRARSHGQSDLDWIMGLCDARSRSRHHGG